MRAVIFSGRENGKPKLSKKVMDNFINSGCFAPCYRRNPDGSCYLDCSRQEASDSGIDLFEEIVKPTLFRGEI